MRKLYRKLCFTLTSVLLVGALCSNAVLYAEAKSDMEKSSYEYKMFDTEEKYEEELKNNMSRVYDILHGHIQEENLCPIPGQIKTVYHEGESDSIKDSIYYIPQGICQTDDYILVTAYHNGKDILAENESNKGWKSVLYVIDDNTHEYLTTLVLPQAYHNGGIAFDGERIWFCGDTKDAHLIEGGPFVQCMDYSRLCEMVNNTVKSEEVKTACIAKEDFSEKITINNKPSFLEYTDGVLWVGTYINNEPNENLGYAIGYPIKEKDGRTCLDKLRVKRIMGIPSSAQGMDIDGNTLYVSSSGHGGENWVESSFVSRYDITSLMKGDTLLDLQGKYVKRIEVPKMNEELMVDDNSVYLLFEAAAEQYLTEMPFGMKTDRILPLDKSLWEE